MPVIQGKHGPLVGAIDEGTSSARFLIFSAETKQIVAKHQIPLRLSYPKEGWVEQDPMFILDVVRECISQAVDNLTAEGCYASDIVAVGITNQRETVVAWDKTTGIPFQDAIVWQDMRTSQMVDDLIRKLPNGDKNSLAGKNGLPISPYFSATKISWLIQNKPEVKLALDENRLLVGTIDTWLIWNLTGGVNNGLHITDVSNASRTMLMHIDTLKWDTSLCEFFDVPMKILPEIHSSAEKYGEIAEGKLQGVPISGVLGDQHAALVGQMCFKSGQAKSTYGTGCFLLYNTGEKRVESKFGLVSTVAYQMGPHKKPVYALEGSVAVAGAAFNWLRDNVDMLSDISQSEALADSVGNTGDVYFVPAFSGLYAPYWISDARGVMCGISETTSRSHIIRATLEAVCFQTRDILDAMNGDCGVPLSRLQVDGGMTANHLLMQLQADLIGIPVVRPKMAETTALGAALAAGCAPGIDLFDLDKEEIMPSDVFEPKITEDERNERYDKWKMAVERSLGWET
ncbi:Glycerol kinase 3 [Frankliniella fusca]|uniref:Probable glycerol kinase n=1 Tax=Frankliniella fusca TaxID=407009 RepID=A0AAE1LKN7_9NEOP|nr:Glycerol kinase 3 [Frankliniella fusca]